MSPWWHPISVQWISVCHWFSLSHYISSMSGHHFFVYSQHMSVISVISQWYRHVSPCFATAQMGPARIIRLCYEVKTAVDLTEQLALGPAMRSLQPGEILEAQDIVTSLSFQCRFGVGTRGRELADVCHVCHVCWDMLSSDGASQDVGYVGCWSWDVEMLRCWLWWTGLRLIEKWFSWVFCFQNKDFHRRKKSIWVFGGFSQVILRQHNQHERTWPFEK